MLHSFSSRYFLVVVGIHWFYEPLYIYSRQRSLVQLKKYKKFYVIIFWMLFNFSKKKTSRKNMQISSHHESNLALRNDSKMMTTMSAVAFFVCSTTYSLYCCSFIQNWTMFLGVVSLVIKDCCCCCLLSVEAHSIHYQYL